MPAHPIYISKEIWNIPLSTDHRALLSIISYECKRHGNCIIRNITLSEELNCSVSKVNKLLKDLEAEKYIHSYSDLCCPPAWSKDTTPQKTRRITTKLTD